MAPRGFIDLAVGPMFSGKSTWLIETLAQYKKHNIPLLAIRYTQDTRYSDNAISSHNNSHFIAENASNSQEIINILNKYPNIQVFGIDEINFFDAQLVDVLTELKRNGVKVYAAGLDTDFLGIPWETTSKIMEQADVITKLTATCSVCHQKNATKTQRLIDGVPASSNSPRILVGGKEAYTARCEEHHQIGG